MLVALDTSFLVELLVTSADRHELTWRCYQRHLQAEDRFVVADHALLETFSVLTRAPRPIGMPAAQAQKLLSAHFGSHSTCPSPPNYGSEAIRHTIARGYWGGRVYDSVIALASHQAGAEVLLTWNLGHFLTVAPAGLEIRTPQ